MPSFRFLLLLAGLVSTVQGALLPKMVSVPSVESMPSVARRLVDEPHPDIDAMTDEWFHRRMTKGYYDVNRKLQAETCEDEEIGSCAFVSIFTDEVSVYESCGGLAEEKDGQWCYSEGLEQRVCCGSADDCCDVKVGAIVGIFIAFLVLLVASICGCCYCCKCCCLYEKFHGSSSTDNNVATATPVVVQAGPGEPVKY